jgi:hypothetical protein
MDYTLAISPDLEIGAEEFAAVWNQDITSRDIAQATTIRGPGVIARALAALDERTASGGSGASKTEVHIHNSNDFTGLKVSSDYDLEKILQKIDKRIEAVSVEAVKRQLAQRRN